MKLRINYQAIVVFVLVFAVTPSVAQLSDPIVKKQKRFNMNILGGVNFCYAITKSSITEGYTTDYYYKNEKTYYNKTPFFPVLKLRLNHNFHKRAEIFAGLKYLQNRIIYTSRGYNKELVVHPPSVIPKVYGSSTEIDIRFNEFTANMGMIFSREEIYGGMHFNISDVYIYENYTNDYNGYGSSFQIGYKQVKSWHTEFGGGIILGYKYPLEKSIFLLELQSDYIQMHPKCPKEYKFAAKAINTSVSIGLRF